MKNMGKILSIFLVITLIFSTPLNISVVSADTGGSSSKNIDKSSIPATIVSGTSVSDITFDRPVVAHEDALVASIEVTDDANEGDIQLFSTDDITPSEFNTIFAPNVTNSIPEQKLSFKSFASEEISSYNGELTLRFSDISLPGRNGLNLNIGRVYQTAQADFAAKKIMQVKNSYGALVNINTYDDSSYLNDRYSLGTGWSFNFPSVQISKDYIPYLIEDTYAYDVEQKVYYHTGDGGVY
ncbi:MAG: hypothetical protein GX800_09980 [Clostridiaceae bacterium]|nr:hypothetical protein [Clostridiaceae bacterium]